MNDHWRAAFPRGCRVVVDVVALQQYRWSLSPSWRTRLAPPYTGTVLGYGREAPEPTLRIQFDGRAPHGNGTPIYARVVRRLAAAP